MIVLSPDDLKITFDRIEKYEKRFGVEQISNFVLTNNLPMICGVIGLRRTGKTTMLWHAIDSLPKNQNKCTVYFEMESGDCMADLYFAIKEYNSKGFVNFFVDEITNVYDFAEKGAPLANTYAAKGLKIIVSGTDSLLLNIVSYGDLYNKMVKINTTWMPWREYAKISKLNGKESDGIHSFDDYLENGGILYNNPDEKENIKYYIQASIIDNLIHSLDYDHNGRNYNELSALRNNGKLRSFILHVLNDNTHRFIFNLLMEKQKFQELEEAYGKVRNKNSQINEKDIEIIRDAIKKRIGFEHWKPGEPIPHDDELKAINEWLILMDVFVKDPIRPEKNNVITQHLLAQPALRWHQVLNVFDEIFNNEEMRKSLKSSPEKLRVSLTSPLKGEILEDIVLTDAIKTLKDSNIFSWKFSVSEDGRQGEFDMIIEKKFEQNPENYCDIVEIKKSRTFDWEHSKHLRHQPFIKRLAECHHRIRHRIVLYGGEEFMDYDDIMHLNVKNFLMSLPDYHDTIQFKFDQLKDKREIYDRVVEKWINEKLTVAQLKSHILKYLERPVTDKDKHFADWLRTEKIDIPNPLGFKPLNENAHTGLLIDGNMFSWNDLQNKIQMYDISDKKGVFFDWLNENMYNVNTIRVHDGTSLGEENVSKSKPLMP